MLPLFISGVFLAGLMFVDKLRKPSEPWNNREEHRKFQQKQEQWKNDGWMLYR